MDFLKLLRSFEDLIFEAASWLLFYPRTLVWIVAKPLEAMAYSDAEQTDDEEGRYDDSVSPPLLLLFTVVIANLIALALHVPPPQESSPLAKTLLGSPQNLVLLRSLIFSLIPLVSAATLVRRLGLKLCRENLRPPFYAQCFLAAPLAISVGSGVAILQRQDVSHAIGWAMILAGLAWFTVVQTRWYAARLDIGRGQALGLAVWAIARAIAYLSVIVAALATL